MVPYTKKEENMPNRPFIFALVTALTVLFCCSPVFCAEKKDATVKQVNPPAAPGAAKTPALPAKGSFSMIGGKLLRIDSSDPANIKLEVKSETDNSTHTVLVTPSTNVTKVTDIAELKAGDTVRVMARRADGKEIAMGVLFGKIKALPAPRPGTVMPPPPVKPQAPPTSAKDLKKK
jgi:hypothetical protein